MFLLKINYSDHQRMQILENLKREHIDAYQQHQVGGNPPNMKVQTLKRNASYNIDTREQGQKMEHGMGNNDPQGYKEVRRKKIHTNY